VAQAAGPQHGSIGGLARDVPSRGRLRVIGTPGLARPGGYARQRLVSGGIRLDGVRGVYLVQRRVNPWGAGPSR